MGLKEVISYPLDMNGRSTRYFAAFTINDICSAKTVIHPLNKATNDDEALLEAFQWRETMDEDSSDIDFEVIRVFVEGANGADNKNRIL
jgi:hypothetical protein